jgi:putative IMPACT (imprinted ancient) family translation regulator
MGDPETHDAYRTLASPGEAKLKEKGSVFLAHAVPVNSPEQADTVLENWRKTYHDATHVGWARRLGTPPDGEERWDDDGEPHGSTGQPILHSIRGADLWGVLVGVVRWYGGTKLGVGGLVRAYGGAAAMALKNASMKTVIQSAQIQVTVPHDRAGAVYTLAERENARVSPPQAGAETMSLVLTVPRSRAEGLAAELRDATAGRAEIKALP